MGCLSVAAAWPVWSLVGYLLFLQAGLDFGCGHMPLIGDLAAALSVSSSGKGSGERGSPAYLSNKAFRGAFPALLVVG
jgi:hypothetical protein